MGVIMQAFYWDCPKEDGNKREYKWWTFVEEKVGSLSKAGFTALWLPPANKAANIGGPSMGYDPYDYYDLGDIDQKGSVKTWFGGRSELLSLINAAHTNGMQVYADLVLNHNNGGDAKEVSPFDGRERWTKFNPKSGKFLRDNRCFHPSPYETWDDAVFGDMPDLCHRDPYVYTQIIEYARWLLEEIGYDGFRYDYVKGYGGWMIRAIQEMRVLRGGISMKPYGVGECWDGDRAIDEWLDETNAWSDNPLSAFDFPLRDRLKNLCDTYGYSLGNLADSGVVMKDRPSNAVTFVENHDIIRDNAIINDKMMAYSYILTHEGYPSVFWQDYYNFGLGMEGKPGGIAALVRIHEDYASGKTSVLYADDGLYIMQREGGGGQKGLIYVLNNRGNSWNGAVVRTVFGETRFTPGAWSGRDSGVPDVKFSDADGACDFWAPPRGYTVYLPR